jgi:hypothetical protein
MPEASLSSSRDRPAITRKKCPQRSRVANGSELWAGIDHRSLWARRAAEQLRAHLSDLGDNISEAEHALAKRCSVLVVELERREALFAQEGSATDEALQVYQTTVNTLRRTLEALGLRRRPRNITPSIEEYARYVADRREASA